MDLIYKIKDKRNDGIFGELYGENEKKIAVTLDHSYIMKDGSIGTKVPPGKYKCVRGLHRLENMKTCFETFEITGLPNFNGNPVTKVLFHIGNWNKDSEGCILLGEFIQESKNGRMITLSRESFISFMEIQEGVNEFNLNVLDTTSSTQDFQVSI